MLPFCLPGSGNLSIEKISAPDNGHSRHATFDPLLSFATLQSGRLKSLVLRDFIVKRMVD
jgi:hypothetical protein